MEGIEVTSLRTFFYKSPVTQLSKVKVQRRTEHSCYIDSIETFAKMLSPLGMVL